jgi:hypothetical protein
VDYPKLESRKAVVTLWTWRKIAMKKQKKRKLTKKKTKTKKKRRPGGPPSEAHFLLNQAIGDLVFDFWTRRILAPHWIASK